jgi:hypothetical protein
MFLCLPSTIEGNLQGTLTYEFLMPADLAQVLSEERRLLYQFIAGNESNAQVLRAKADENRERMIAGIEFLGRLAANDGAVVIEPGFHVKGSGFIIIPRDADKAGQTPSVLLCQDAAGTKRVARDRPGGARHKVGINFAWSHPGAVVFIVSADGPVTCALREGNEVLTWSVRLPET